MELRIVPVDQPTTAITRREGEVYAKRALKEGGLDNNNDKGNPKQERVRSQAGSSSIEELTLRQLDRCHKRRRTQKSLGDSMHLAPSKVRLGPTKVS
jgi:hypothetical protein